MKNTLIIIFLCFTAHLCFAQQNKRPGLTGTYALVLVDNIGADGSRIHLYGQSPHGILILDAKGHYALQIVSDDRPKFASADKSKGTDEENRTTVTGMNSHFGTYKLNDAKQTVTFFIDHASFPNWEGTKQERPFTLKSDTLTYTVPSPTTGSAVSGEVVWKRIE